MKHLKEPGTYYGHMRQRAIFPWMKNRLLPSIPGTRQVCQGCLNADHKLAHVAADWACIHIHDNHTHTTLSSSPSLDYYAPPWLNFSCGVLKDWASHPTGCVTTIHSPHSLHVKSWDRSYASFECMLHCWGFLFLRLKPCFLSSLPLLFFLFTFKILGH